MHFGASLRLLRVEAGLSVRELARQIGVSSAYLSRVENGRDAPPTPERLIAVADALRLPRAALLELARQSGPAVHDYLGRVPAAGALFLDIARRDLDTVSIARIKRFIDREFPDNSKRARVTRLLDILPQANIITGFAGFSLRDLLEVAVTRLPDTPDRRAVLQRILAREEASPTCIGGGFVAPHAVIPGAPDGAVLVTMARPLALSPPDGEPVRVALVILGGEAGPRFLDTLSRVARLASYGVSGELCAAGSPEAVREIVERLEGLW